MTPYNYSKLQILSAVSVLAETRIKSNLYTLGYLTGQGRTATKQQLHKLARQNYILADLDAKKECGCMLKYRLTAKGKRCMQAMLDRFEAGQDLNIRKRPNGFDWSGYRLLPNFDKVRMKKADFYNMCKNELDNI